MEQDEKTYMKLDSGVYEIKNIISGNRYIGGSTNIYTRFNTHKRQLTKGKHHNQYLQRSWDKYGDNSFTFQILLFCSKENVLLYEQALLNGLRPEFNIAKDAAAPMAGLKHTEETCRKMSISKMGNPSNLGKHLSDETKRKIGLASIGNKYSVGNTNRRGKHHTDETKEKLRLSHLGNKYALGNKSCLGKHPTAETRAKLSAAQMGNKKALGKKRSEETKAKIRASLKEYYKDKVICLVRTDEHNRHISEALKGRAFSEEHKRKISESKILYYQRMKMMA